MRRIADSSVTSRSGESGTTGGTPATATPASEPSTVVQDPSEEQNHDSDASLGTEDTGTASGGSGDGGSGDKRREDTGDGGSGDKRREDTGDGGSGDKRREDTGDGGKTDERDADDEEVREEEAVGSGGEAGSVGSRRNSHALQSDRDDDSSESEGNAKWGNVWRVLVTDYRANHTRRDMPSDEDEDPASPESMASVAKKTATGFGHAAGVMSGTASALTLDNAIHAAKLGDSYNQDKPDQYMRSRSEAGGYLRLFAGATAFSGSLAGLYGTYGDYRGAKRKGLRNKRRQTKFDALAGVSNAASGILSMTSAGMGISGADPKKSGIVGMASFFASGLGSAFKTIGAATGAVHHRRVAERAGQTYGQPDGNSEEADKQTIKDNEHSKDPGTGEKNHARSAAKARLYAMAQAAEYNREKAQQEKGRAWREGIFGIGAALSGIGGGAFSLAGGKGLLGMFGSSISGLLSTGLKFGGAIANASAKKKAGQKSSERMHRVVDGYISNKLDKVKKDARDKRTGNRENPAGSGLTDAEVHDVTDSEIIQKKIALARLGIEVAKDERGITEDVYKEAFKAITFRRAKNIRDSGDDRRSMLSALGLPNGATVEEIAEALGYEG